MGLFSSGSLISVFARVLLAGAISAAPIEIVPPNFADARQPQVAVGDDASVYVTFGRGEDLFLSVSRDCGHTFNPPQKLGSLTGLALGMRRGPRIAVSGRFVTVTAQAKDLFAFHSGDAGQTWSAPVRINTTAQSAREGLHALAQGSSGRMFATWLDLRSGHMELYGAASNDGGATWGEDFSIYRSPDEHICECCHPSAAFNADGDLALMWRNWLDGSRDLWSAVLPAGQHALADLRKQGRGTWKLNGCPMDGGAIFSFPDGSFGSVWRREKTVYLSLAPDDEQRIANGVQPFAVAARGVVHVFWQDGDNLLHTTNRPGEAPAAIAANAKFGSAAVLPSGQIAVVFERIYADRNSIFALLLP